MKKLLLSGLAICISGWLSAQCDVLYVTTTGSPSGAGTMMDPVDINTAFTNATNGTVVRLATGTYNILNALIIPDDSVIFEGGFVESQNWTKTSLAGATTINRQAINPEGSANSQRLVAVYGVGVSGFRFQDITVSTANGNSVGMSTYGMHLTSCSDYKLIRTRLLPGNASNGANGLVGSPGATGGNGYIGGSGSCDAGSCTFSSGWAGPAGGAGGSGGGGTGPGAGGPSVNGQQNNGTAGGTGTGRNGGGGGGGGAGGDECSSNNAGVGGAGGGSACGSGPTGGNKGSDGDPGTDGQNGTNGANGSAGTPGSSGAIGTHVAGFFVPGAQAGAGTDGCGGRGGSGGGGGGRQVCSLCDNGTGCGGSGGGGGGQGGTGGTGGRGGGASFGLYLFLNGANAEIIQSEIVPGNFGSGGVGGAGGNGGSGGSGAGGNTTCSGEIGSGGAGGNGGSGGNGGPGGNGAGGVSEDIHIASGSALAAQESTFDLVNQPEINVTYSTCTNNTITVQDMTSPTGPGYAAWDFGLDASTPTSTDNPADIEYSNTGFKDILNGTDLYHSFVNLTCTGYMVDIDTAICQGGSVTIGSNTYTTTGNYTDVFTSSNGCDSTVNLNLTVNTATSGSENVIACGSYTWSANNQTYTSSGSYMTLLTGSNGCDSTATIYLTINYVDLNVSAAGGTLTSNQAGGTYQWIDCGNGNQAIAGETGQSYTPTANGSYAVVVTANGCTDTSSCQLINNVGLSDVLAIEGLTLYPNPSNGKFTIDFNNKMDEVYIEVRDVTGKIVYDKVYKNTSKETIRLHRDAGLYFVNVHAGDQISVIRVIVE